MTTPPIAVRESLTDKRTSKVLGANQARKRAMASPESQIHRLLESPRAVRDIEEKGHSPAGLRFACARAKRRTNENGGTMAAVVNMSLLNSPCQAVGFLRRRVAAAPTSPAPKRESVRGSGTSLSTCPVSHAVGSGQ